MREFVFFSRKGKTTGNFNTENLMAAGRLDIVCHSVISAFFISEGMRGHVRFHLILNGPPDPPKHIIMEPDQDTPISKKDIGNLIRICLYKFEEGEKVKAFPGIWVERKSFQDLIREKKDGNLILLDEKGEDVDKVEIGEDPIFIVGDHLGIPKGEKKFLERYEPKKIKIGPLTYFTSHTISYLNIKLDQEEIF